jgi:CTP synthase (UTP-ammonia lyase)
LRYRWLPHPEIRIVHQKRIVVGIVGDRNAQHPLHLLTEQALSDGPQAPAIEWIPTDQVAMPGASSLARYAGFLISPGSPYRGMAGALAAIRYARENGVPLLGTCGGFQHVIVEFVRNAGGVTDADHEETNPGAAHLAVTALECSVAGEIHGVRPLPGSKAASIYGADEVLEPFYCNYGLNSDYRALIESHGLKVSGVDKAGAVRIVELPTHPFFLATLYVPQARHRSGEPHPLLSAFIAAARSSRVSATTMQNAANA